MHQRRTRPAGHSEGATITLTHPIGAKWKDWSGCLDRVFEGNPARMSDVNDLDGDVRSALLDARTGAGRSKNQVFRMSRPPLP